MSFCVNLLTPIMIGVILNLDKQVLGPFMVGRPLVTGFIIGLITGEVAFGTWMGMSTELLWLATMPLGGQLTPNAGLAVTAALTAWITSGFAPAVGAYSSEAGLVVSFLTIPPWAKAFTFIDKGARRLVIPQLAQARADLAQGRDPRFFQRNLLGVLTTLIFSLAAVAAAVAVNSFLLKLVLRLTPEFVLNSLEFIYNLIPFLGLLGMAVAYLEKSTFTFYLVSLLVSLLTISAVS